MDAKIYAEDGKKIGKEKVMNAKYIKVEKEEDCRTINNILYINDRSTIPVEKGEYIYDDKRRCWISLEKMKEEMIEKIKAIDTLFLCLESDRYVKDLEKKIID